VKANRPNPLAPTTSTREIEEITDEMNQLRELKGSERALLDQMDGRADAAYAAEEAQGKLAQIRVDIDRYLRWKLAAVILQREIERYRVEHQGPLLVRASELFSKLTLGSFTRHEADIDEQVLLGVRPSGEYVRVEGMSDSTLDQLYLSLRLASLERYLESNEPIPFIVDDILIRFDDLRSEATMKVLAELSMKTQVLFFMHHTWLLELAKKVAGDGGLIIHELNA